MAEAGSGKGQQHLGATSPDPARWAGAPPCAHRVGRQQSARPHEVLAVQQWRHPLGQVRGSFAWKGTNQTELNQHCKGDASATTVGDSAVELTVTGLPQIGPWPRREGNSSDTEGHIRR